ncbi:GntR family transcriptional regulator, partial [Lactobacillus sp. UMNPBX5]
MKYIEIYNDLKRAILRREIAPNALVPSEKALTIKYHV